MLIVNAILYTCVSFKTDKTSSTKTPKHQLIQTDLWRKDPAAFQTRKPESFWSCFESKWWMQKDLVCRYICVHVKDPRDVVLVWRRHVVGRFLRKQMNKWWLYIDGWSDLTVAHKHWHSLHSDELTFYSIKLSFLMIIPQVNKIKALINRYWLH